MADKEGGTPRWMKRKVRARMKETGEKYTQALRAVKAEQAEYEKQTNQTGSEQ